MAGVVSQYLGQEPRALKLRSPETVIGVWPGDLPIRGTHQGGLAGGKGALGKGGPMLAGHDGTLPTYLIPHFHFEP